MSKPDASGSCTIDAANSSSALLAEHPCRPEFDACPWDFLPKATLRFCEDPLCGWVVEPANTWSNIGFIVVGVWILIASSQFTHRLESRLFGWIPISIGMMSGFFHMSQTSLGQVLDFSTMYMASSLVITLNLQRMGKIGSGVQILGAFIGLFAISTLAIILFRPIEIPLFVSHGVIWAITEWLLSRRPSQAGVRYDSLIGVALAMSAAMLVWLLDFHGIVCDPDNHWINGHAIWHLFNAIGIFHWFSFYRQFIDAKA